MVGALGGLEIGMSVAELVRKLGAPASVSSREDEQAKWMDAGYDPGRSPFFSSDFREVLSFSEPPVPLFKAFVSGDRVLGLKFTFYGAEEQLSSAPFGFDHGCVLGALGASAVRAFGEPEARYLESGASRLEKLEYFDRGLSIAIEDGKIVVFDLYVPPSAIEKRRLLERIRRPAPPRPAPESVAPSR